MCPVCSWNSRESVTAARVIRGGGEGNEVRKLKGGAKSYIALKVLVKDLSFTLDKMKNHWHCLFLWRDRKPLKNLSSDTMWLLSWKFHSGYCVGNRPWGHKEGSGAALRVLSQGWRWELMVAPIMEGTAGTVRSSQILHIHVFWRWSWEVFQIHCM